MKENTDIELNPSACAKSRAVMYMCVRGIVFGSFYDFSIGFKKK
jgi:hypothetical protein